MTVRIHQHTMTIDPVKSQGDSGGLPLVASVLHVQNYFFTQAPSVTPFAGGLILAVILVSSAVTAIRSRTHHVIAPF